MTRVGERLSGLFRNKKYGLFHSGWILLIYIDSKKYLSQKSDLDLKTKPDGYLVRTSQALDIHIATGRRILIILLQYSVVFIVQYVCGTIRKIIDFVLNLIVDMSETQCHCEGVTIKVQ